MLTQKLSCTTPIPTIRLENFRDGLEDYEYLVLCERRGLPDIAVDALFLRQFDVQADRFAFGLGRTSIRCFHDPRATSCNHSEVMPG